MKHKSHFLPRTAWFVMLLTTLLLQGTTAATAGNYNEKFTWEMDYIPAESPTTLDEVAGILQQNPSVFQSVTLNKGQGETLGQDTLYFYIMQKLDHFEKDQKQWKYIYQLVSIVKFVGADRPTFMHTNGYNTSAPHYCDLASALNANMIEVEHRFTGNSLPIFDCYAKNGGFLKNENYWNYNVAKQESTDIAYVVNCLKKLKIFNGQWVSTGTSKSGMTTTFLAMHYPETCDVYVPFCAPFCETLHEALGYWACEGYGQHLKELSEESYQTWKISWQRVKEFAKNPVLRKYVIQREKEALQKKYNHVFSDEECLTNVYEMYVYHSWDKATYYQIRDWADLIPSYKGPDDYVSEAYCDSMYTYLSLSGDSIQARNLRRQENGESSQAVQRRSSHYEEQTSLFRKLKDRQLRRASGVDPTTGLDSLIMTLDPYSVQTMYELGSMRHDYTIVKDELEAINGAGYVDRLHKFMDFHKDGYKDVAKYIGLNTTTYPYKPLNPIAPEVKNFVKTTKTKIVFVYGGFDPWTQAGIKDEDIPESQTNISRFVVPGGTHADDVLSKRYSWTSGYGNKIVNKVKELLGVPTAIHNLQTETSTALRSDVMYNLSGQQVDDSYKGIVIKNGKKMVLK